MKGSLPHHKSIQARLVRLVVLLVAALFLSACGGQELFFEKDQNVVQQAQQARLGRQEIPLRQIFAGDWDRIHVFPYAGTKNDLEKTIGIPVNMPDMHEGNIVILMKGTTVQRALLLEPWPFNGNGGSYGPNAIGIPTHGWLKLAH